MKTIFEEYGTVIIVAIAIIALIAIVALLVDGEDSLISKNFKEIVDNFFTKSGVSGLTA